MAQTYESGYQSTLALKLSPADTTVTVATAPTVTSGRLFLKSGSTKERISFTGNPTPGGSNVTLTGLTRSLSKTAEPATGSTGLTWLAGTKVTLVAMHDQLLDVERTGSRTLKGDYTYTGTEIHGGTETHNGVVTQNGAQTINAPVTIAGSTSYLKLPNLTTTQRNALTASVGMLVYDTTLGFVYQYKATGRAQVDTGTATGNATETVAGSVEKATTAEAVAGTDTGGTGAYLFVVPSDIKKLSLGLILGDGTDGALVVASGTTSLTSGTIYNYSSISISAGATLNLSSGGSMNIKCLGTTTVDGTIGGVGAGDYGNTPAQTALFGKIPQTSHNIGTGGNGGKGADTTYGGGAGSGTGGTGGTGASGYGGGGGGGSIAYTGSGTLGGDGGGGGTPGGTGGSGGGSGDKGADGGDAYSNAGEAAVDSAAGGSVNGSNGGTSAGGGGARAGTVAGGGGGGAGGSLGKSGLSLILYTYGRSGTGTINGNGANGGAGGVGGLGASWSGLNRGGSGGGGGGGGGGAGGNIVLLGATNTFSGTVTVTKGTGGALGSGGASGTNVVGGTNGTAGTDGTDGSSTNANLNDYIY